jgi:hypothetical protein
MFFKNKKVVVLLSIIVAIILLSCTFFIIDNERVYNNELPIFCITGESYLDGGTTVYYGIGYKVIVFHSIIDSKTQTYFTEKKIGSWFMDYDDFHTEIEEYRLNIPQYK